MRISEVRELDDSELDKELGEQQRGMMNLRFRKATLQLTNTNELKNARKSVARIKTVIRERAITLDLGPAQPGAEKPAEITPETETDTDTDNAAENEGE
jgi:large subunit ribosomal protein L29